MGIITVKRNGKTLLVHNIQVRLTQKLNDHARAYVSGMLHSGIQDSYLESTTSKSEFMIEYEEEGSDNKILFHGLSLAIRNRSEGIGGNAIYHIEIDLIAFTYLMDIQKINRSFQNHQMSYDHLLDAVNCDQSAAVHGNVASGKQTGQFILQYTETNWAFLKRMASRFNEMLIGDYLSDRPRYKFGLTGTFNQGELEDYAYSVSRDLSAFRRVAENGQLSSVSDLDYITFTVATEGNDPTIFSVGDWLTFKNKVLHIEAVETVIRDYRFLTTYKLKTKQGLRQIAYHNEKITGISLIGTVIDVAENVLKVHLNLDDDQEVGDASWFRYATIYSNWYCMPEKGDRVNLYFPNEDESQGIVINSVRV